jgi:hypothetical protein
VLKIQTNWEHASSLVGLISIVLQSGWIGFELAWTSWNMLVPVWRSHCFLFSNLIFKRLFCKETCSTSLSFSLFDRHNVIIAEISSMGAMVQRPRRMRLSCGLSQKNWLVSQAILRSGFMVITELIVFLYSLLHDWVFGIKYLSVTATLNSTSHHWERFSIIIMLALAYSLSF